MGGADSHSAAGVASGCTASPFIQSNVFPEPGKGGLPSDISEYFHRVPVDTMQNKVGQEIRAVFDCYSERYTHRHSLFLLPQDSADAAQEAWSSLVLGTDLSWSPYSI